MRMNKYIFELGLAGVIFSTLPAMSDGTINIRWDSLNLSSKQKQEIQELDTQWQEVNSSIRPKLIRDQQKLKLMISDPEISEEQIRQMQKQIFLRREQLRQTALDNFLSKRRILNLQQREKLHQMLTK